VNNQCYVCYRRSRDRVSKTVCAECQQTLENIKGVRRDSENHIKVPGWANRIERLRQRAERGVDLFSGVT